MSTWSEAASGKHSEGRHTVQQDVVVLTFYRFQVLFENGLTAHGIHQRDLQTRQRDVCRNKIHALFMRQDTLLR